MQNKIVDAFNANLRAGGNGMIARGLPVLAAHEYRTAFIDFRTRHRGLANELFGSSQPRILTCFEAEIALERRDDSQCDRQRDRQRRVPVMKGIHEAKQSEREQNGTEDSGSAIRSELDFHGEQKQREDNQEREKHISFWLFMKSN